MFPLNNELESCWYQKLTDQTKIILYPKLEGKHIQGRYFMALKFFNKVVWFVLAAMLGILLPSNMAAKTTFCLFNLVKRLIVTLRCAVDDLIFSTFSLKFKCKICVQKEVIHNFKNHILVTWPATNLLILRKWCGFEKPNHYYFV